MCEKCRNFHCEKKFPTNFYPTIFTDFLNFLTIIRKIRLSCHKYQSYKMRVWSVGKVIIKMTMRPMLEKQFHHKIE